MNRYDDEDPRYGARPGNRDARHDPYETRQGRSSGEGRERQRWADQPARYGSRRDEELWSAPRGDARYGLDTGAEREYGRHLLAGQNNSGYEAARSYGQGRYGDDARSDLARASWTQEHNYEGPRYGERSAYGSQYGSRQGQPDTYGGAGFRQEGKRYWFDEGDQRGQFRGTRPRGYERSDERLRELVCERLTEADIDASDIEVKVDQGNVTLEGSVPSRWMRHQAEDIVDDCGGVKDIQNHLRIHQGGVAAGGNVTGTTTSPAPGATVTGTGQTTMGTSPSSQGEIGGRSRH